MSDGLVFWLVTSGFPKLRELAETCAKNRIGSAERLPLTIQDHHCAKGNQLPNVIAVRTISVGRCCPQSSTAFESVKGSKRTRRERRLVYISSVGLDSSFNRTTTPTMWFSFFSTQISWHIIAAEKRNSNICLAWNQKLGDYICA